MGLINYISKQFSNPKGLGGKIISMVMNRQNYPLYEETVQLLSPTGAESVLDIGCGSGFVLNMIARQCELCKLIGIDTSTSIIKTANKRNRKFVKSDRTKCFDKDF